MFVYMAFITHTHTHTRACARTQGYFVFLGPHLLHMEILRPGVTSELQLQPTPQPQKPGI